MQIVQIWTGTTTSCILVKKHPAVDFLIKYNPAGKVSKKLFLVQVSAQKYQNRDAEHRYQAIKQHFSTYECFKEESPLDVYLRKTDVLKTNCHFVYALTADSMVDKEDCMSLQAHTFIMTLSLIM